MALGWSHVGQCERPRPPWPLVMVGTPPWASASTPEQHSTGDLPGGFHRALCSWALGWLDENSAFGGPLSPMFPLRTQPPREPVSRLGFLALRTSARLRVPVPQRPSPGPSHL